jgi:hypothetical protein
MFAIQLARRAGYKVIATASPSSFELVKSYGAHHLVSYRDQDAALIRNQEIDKWRSIRWTRLRRRSKEYHICSKRFRTKGRETINDVAG